ncbi:RND transporter [Pedobacter ginsengisoli]|uniref:RND transporter n=1 Tax=Pedobacter ginsengisoli TaxID=363852 RepID=A0A2D1U6A9_9SPHI|nr:HlyD family efflux transporter periplasmic adaptor subunit [Pedobacter ginsengisoli]ATP57122.1 RND transporter [Pedobacter ginsengisoli]
MSSKLTLGFALICLILNGCGPVSTSGNQELDKSPEPKTPVSITQISNAPLSDYIELNATATFQQKGIIKASSNGYLQTVNVKKGDYIKGGQTLFTIITKEAKSIGNAINNLDPSFKFTGLTRITANTAGFAGEVSHQKGDYVQEGEQLAVITNLNSFVFLMDLPYELTGIIKNQKALEVTLPNGEKLIGNVGSALPLVDSASQTQRIIIQVKTQKIIPEGLVAKVKLIRSESLNPIALPKESVLANETQDEFWVMKLINDTTAVKINIQKGLETRSYIEIKSPLFKPDDRFILTGNYGLSDTAKITINHK